MARTTTDRTVEINGFTLRFVRELRARKTAELAEKMKDRLGGCDRSYITHIENGTKTRVSVEFYNALLLELDISDHRVLLANPHVAIADQVPV